MSVELKSLIREYRWSLMAAAAIPFPLLTGHYLGSRGLIDPMEFYAFAPIFAICAIALFYLEATGDDVHNPDGAITAREFWFGESDNNSQNKEKSDQ